MDGFYLGIQPRYVKNMCVDEMENCGFDVNCKDISTLYIMFYFPACSLFIADFVSVSVILIAKGDKIVNFSSVEWFICQLDSL